MSNICTVCALVILSSFTFFSPAVAAEDRDRNANFFLTIGRTFVEDDDFKDEMNALKIGTGYKFSPYFGFELFYIYYGSISEKIDALNTGEFKAYAAALNGIAILPLGSLFELYGKAGISKWKVEAELNNANIASVDGEDPVFALGFGYHIDYDSTIRLEYEMSDYDGTTFSVISFGFQHNF